jgi:hypothetical protein
VGSAAKSSRGETKLGLSATAAAAALYGAVILFGVGAATPSAASANEVRSPVVHLPHDLAASGPDQRQPQVSPGPDRQPSRSGSTLISGNVTALPASAADEPEEGPAPAPGQPPPALAPASSPASPGSPTPAPTASQSPPTEPINTVPVVTVPTVTVPPVTVPTVTVPGLPLPPAPELPPLPPAPSLPLP